MKSYPQITAVRLNQLNAYFRREVMNDDFVCMRHTDCKASATGRAFYEGQLHHLGTHYDLEIDGRPMRIVIVGQEYGSDTPLVDLDQRHETILKSASLGWRGRNPHMKGTTTLLRLLHGRDPGKDDEGEQLLLESGETIHLFEGFALANYLLCSAVREGSTHGQATDTMRHNCARHFKQAIEILEPTLIVLQGYGVRQWIAKAYACPWNRGNDERLNLEGRQTRVLTFYHPSYRKRPWGRDLYSEYVYKAIAPVIGQACSA